MKIKFYSPTKSLLIFSILLLWCSNICAGGLWIDPDKLYFNGKRDSGEFRAGKSIRMNFSYDNFIYSGKDYSYIVFVLVERKENTNVRFIGSFVARIFKDEHESQAFFYLPKEGSRYELHYNVTIYFSNYPLNSGMYGDFLNDSDVELIKQFYEDPSNHEYYTYLSDLRTLASPSPLDSEKDLTIYFENPTRVIEDLEAGKPLTFKWKVGPESTKYASSIQYSFRLNPIEDWTIYSNSNRAEYNYLRVGNYTFEVKAKYLLNNELKESKVASYSITVKKEIFSLSKREIEGKNTKKPPEEFYKQSHYNKSKALLIGVSKYSDRGSFIALPFVNYDIETMRDVLVNKYSFDKVDILNENTTKNNIIKKFNDFYNDVEEGDRVVVYFSGHGTSEYEKGFLVPTDGYTNNKVKTCIDLDFISNWIDNLLSSKKVQHILFIVDACYSGLGVLSKSSSSSPLLELVKYPSAHIMTAGLMFQEALSVKLGNQSVFTKYLVEGLEGKADWSGDDVITLNELICYVQNEVAEYVKNEFDKTQTPVMAKLKGNGEMIFLLK